MNNSANSNDNKNLIIAIVLMVVVWLGFSTFFPSKQPEQAPVASDAAVTQQLKDSATPTAAEAVVEQAAEVVSEPVAPVGEAPIAVTAPAAATTLAPAREIVVDTDRYRAVFSTRGARLLSFELKDYRATAAEDSPPVQMFTPDQPDSATLKTFGAEGFALNADAPFESQAKDTVAVAAGEQFELSFRHVAASGLVYTKSYLLNGDTYTVDTLLNLRNSGPAPLSGRISLALVQAFDEEAKTDRYSFVGPVSLIKGKLEDVKVKKLKDGPVTYSSDFAWTSFQTKYFLSVLVPEAQAAERVQLVYNGKTVENRLESPSIVLPSGADKSLKYLLYIGPKEPALLQAAGHGLDQVVHFGFFDVLAQPLFTVLTFFYGFFKNYGVAIILLTVLIKLLFWPLTHKSYSSMKAMQRLQPEMQKMRERYKNDKEKLNKEMMGLYKTHSVNPLGGCLPMIIQIPVFFALYKVLLDSIALRHAPFMFWLTDLSAKDPYYITPLLMGASMFVQQKMTPTTADPMQAKMFMMMPVVFTFLFLNFPSGLVIYWLVNNLLTILQQYFIHRKAA